MPSRFILNEFNLNLASARLLVRFWFLVLVVLVAGTVVGVLVVYELVRGRGMGGLVGALCRVVLHGGRLLVWGIGRVRVYWRDCGGLWAAKGHTICVGRGARERGEGEAVSAGRKRQGDERGKGWKWGQRPDEDRQMRGLLGALRGSRNRIPFPATTAYLYPELSQAHPQTITYFHSQTS